MKTIQWTIVSVLAGALFSGVAAAQSTSTPVRQPVSIQEINNPAGYAVADVAPSVAAPTGVPTSPSNEPPAPPAPPAAKPAGKPAAEAPKEEAKKDEEKKDEEKKDEEKPAEEGPVKIFHGPWFDCMHLDVRGYLEAGYTYNPTSPLSGFNGPDGYNDLANQGVLDQLYLIAERVTKVEKDCGTDYGYRVNLMYGTDAHFVSTTPGTQWDSGWNGGSPYYGLAMPQLYGDYAVNKLLLRGGHFYAPCGYENPMPTENFFYSHTYGFLYGMPTTLTGGMATYKVWDEEKCDQLTVNAGLDTGWNNFESPNGTVNYLFGFNWTSADTKITVGSEWFIGNTELAGFSGTRVECCTDINVTLGKKWHYILENTVAHDSNLNGAGPASWTGWTNYLLYDINDCWGFGFRYEYFEDLDAGAVPAVGLGVDPLTGVAVPVLGSKYNDLTLGLNWKPNKNVTVRTEVRWDWAGNTGLGGRKPYDDGGSDSQFLWGNDVVVRF